MNSFASAVEEIIFSQVRGYYRIQPFLDRFRKQLIPNPIYKSPKKMNLGSSVSSIPGYLNIDALKERNPDIVCDIRKLKFAEDDEYDLVRASHVLEHFCVEEIPALLSEWRRVIKPGGYFVVCVPNYIALSWRAILKPSGFNLDQKTYQNGWINGLYALDLPPEYRHKIVFTYRSLSKLLNENGFEVIGKLHFRMEEPFTLGISDNSCDNLSLNVVARKL
jgi:predicted SAM-dependent methyltransferase